MSQPNQQPQQQYGQPQPAQAYGYLGPSYADTQIQALHQALQIQHAQLQQQAEQLRFQHQAIYGVGFGAGIGLPPVAGAGYASSLTYPPLSAFPAAAGVTPFSLPQYAPQYAYHQHHAIAAQALAHQSAGAATSSAQPVTGTAQYSAVLGAPPQLHPLQHNTNHHHHHAAPTTAPSAAGGVNANANSSPAADNRAGASAGAALSLSTDSASSGGVHMQQFDFPTAQNNLSRANLYQMNSMQAAQQRGSATATTLDVPPPPSTGDDTLDPVSTNNATSPSATHAATRHAHPRNSVRQPHSSSVSTDAPSTVQTTSLQSRSAPTSNTTVSADGVTTTTSNMMAPTAGAAMMSVTTTARRAGDNTLAMPQTGPADSHASPHGAAVPPNVMPEERRQLIVKFLTQETTEAELKRLFSRLGHVEHVRIICDRATGKTKGYGFVDFEKPADATAAVKKMRGYPLCGKRLKVSFVSTVRRDAADNARAEHGDFDGDDFDDELELEHLLALRRDEGTQTLGDPHASNVSMAGSTTRSHIDNSASPSTTSHIGGGKRGHIGSSTTTGQSGSGASASGSGSGSGSGNNAQSQNSGSNGSSDEGEQRSGTSPSSAEANGVPSRETGFGVLMSTGSH